MTHDVQRRIEQEILRLFRREVLTHDLHASSPQLIEYVEAYLQRPAKRIRPWLLGTAAAAYGFSDREAVLRVGAATELLHVFALMHDDRLDGEERITTESEPEKRDHPYQVLGGDFLHSVAMHTLHDAVREFALSDEILDVIQSISLTTIAGQASDIEFLDHADVSPSIDRLHTLYDVKTGYYSFVAPLTIGGIMGDAPASDRGTLTALGLELGRVYQIRDDVADIREYLARIDAEDTSLPPRWEFNLLSTYLFESQGIDIRNVRDSDSSRHDTLWQLSVDSLEAFVDDVTAPELARCRSFIRELNLSPDNRAALHDAVVSLEHETRYRA